VNNSFDGIIKEILQTSAAKEIEVIQSLWSGYGKLSRLELSEDKTVIAKNIILPSQSNHPRGWNTTNSHLRKIKSYQVETNWYKNYAYRCNNYCRVPLHFYSVAEENELLILMEDMDAAGYPIRKASLNKNETKLCLDWLAHFHATFLNEKPIGLWKTGTYWHFDTRPDEYETMKNGPLKDKAEAIDNRLNNCQFKTFVHGDAKVANFCFSDDLKKVAAVDFQYVGGGCGIKDVIYLMGSCLNDVQCEQYESELLDYYFASLKGALLLYKKDVDFQALEKEWRLLYPVAWTDFTRFLLGWMPTHQKINNYSKRLMAQVLD